MKALFESYGTMNGSGRLDFKNFLAAVNPGDFGESNNWQYGETFNNKARTGGGGAGAGGALTGRTGRAGGALRTGRIAMNPYNPMSHRAICSLVNQKISERGHKFSGQQVE